MMIKTLKNIWYSLYTSRTMRSLFALGMIFSLSGCEDDSEISLTTADTNCWQSAITQKVLSIVDKLYHQGNELVVQYGHPGANLIFVAFAVWLAFKLLKVLTSFKEESLGEVWTEIFQKLFLCAFCAFLIMPRPGASSPVDEALNYFVLPIYQTFIELGVRLLSPEQTGLNIKLGDFGSISFAISDEKCTSLVSSFFGGGASPLSSRISAGHLQSALNPVTDCIICEISDRLNSGYVVGVALIASLSLGEMLVGFMVVFLFTVAKFGFVLYLIDSLFRLNFAIFLFPALIVGIPFSYTRKWSKHGFEMFINSSGIMFFMALLVTICSGAIEKIMNDYLTITSKGIAAKDTALFAMFLISLLMVNLPGFAVILANKFIGGGNGQEFNEKISKFLINTMKAVGGSAINTISGGATSLATKTMQKYEESRQALDHIKQAKHRSQSIINSLAGYNDDEEDA